MCSAYLKSCNIEVPVKLDDKRIAVENHKKSMLSNSKDLKKIKLEPLIRSSYELAAQAMTSN